MVLVRKAAGVDLALLNQLAEPIQQGFVLVLQCGHGLAAVHQVVEQLVGAELLKIKSLSRIRHG